MDKYRWNPERNVWEFNEPAWGGWMTLRRGPHDSNPPMTFDEGFEYFKDRGIPIPAGMMLWPNDPNSSSPERVPEETTRCDCWQYEHQVCDVCQKVDSRSGVDRPYRVRLWCDDHHTQAWRQRAVYWFARALGITLVLNVEEFADD